MAFRHIKESEKKVQESKENRNTHHIYSASPPHLPTNSAVVVISYTEAQELLQIINTRISAKETKERKTAEEALYTPGGKRVHARHPDWDPNVCNTIAKGQIYIGMSKEQVSAAWGRPYTINTTTGAYGTHEQWFMHEMGRSYVYFENGICTTIQN
jgi:hypothetical protein